MSARRANEGMANDLSIIFRKSIMLSSRYFIHQLLVALVVLMICGGLVFHNSSKNKKLTVAIANYGPHASLFQSVQGLKEVLSESGYIEGKNVQVEYMDVGFDPGLIGQMLNTLISRSPDILVPMTTPVSQFVKGQIVTGAYHVPVVFSTLTDPYQIGIANHHPKISDVVTVSTDHQDMHYMLQFAQQLLPHAKRVGMLYATSESNDIALLAQMREVSKELGYSLYAVAVNTSQDVASAMTQFKNQVDFIFVGASGPIQPSLPVIAHLANQYHIPIINMDDAAVKDGYVLASFGVNYNKVGRNTGQLVVEVLDTICSQVSHGGIKTSNKQNQNRIINPLKTDYKAVVSQSIADQYHLVIPTDRSDLLVVQ